MSGDPQGVLFSYADGVVREILRSLRGERILSIFVSGSAARGEVAGFSGPSGIEVYSDLDLFVILDRPKDLESARRRARAAGAAVPRTGEGYAVFPEPDIGVFSEEDFLGQKERPGTVEIAASHVVLHGSQEMPRRAERFLPARIHPCEALYLLENRLIEMAGLSERLRGNVSVGLRRYAFYVHSKSCLDAVSAVLIVAGRYDPVRAERMKRFDEEVAAGGWNLPEAAAAQIRRCLANVESLQGGELKDAETPDRRDAVEEVLAGVWRTAARRLSGGAADDAWDLVGWRCQRGRRFANGRELSLLARRLKVGRTGLIGRAAALTRFSPADALRLSGLVGAMLRRQPTDGAGDDSAPREYLDYIDALTRSFGRAEGPPLDRARRLFQEAA